MWRELGENVAVEWIRPEFIGAGNRCVGQTQGFGLNFCLRVHAIVCGPDRVHV